MAQLMSQYHDIKVVAQLNSSADDPYFASMSPLQGSPIYMDNGMPVNIVAPRRAEIPLLRLSRTMTGSRRTARQGLSLYRFLLERRLMRVLADRDLIHCVNATMEHLAVSAARCAARLQRPFVLTPLFRLEDRDAADALRSPLRVAHAVIAQTPFEAEQLKHLGVPDNKVRVLSAGPIVSEGADPESFKRRYSIRGNVVLFLGRKERSKGYELVLRAADFVWKEHPDTYFVFAGPRTVESSRIFSASRDPRIIEIGALDPWSKEKSSALAACDVFCMPSVPECSGVVFLEAWSFGKPVIAADIPSERDFVSHGTDGLLVKTDPHDIARALLLLLGDHPLRQRMGAAGKAKTSEHYSWNRIVERMNSIYEEVVKGAGQHTSRGKPRSS
jgi:glycosyltransferase involved in cell wall biosynthesis